MKKHNIDVGVVIITYNSRAFIGVCLDSLLNSNGVCSTITVVDNASTDGTVELVEKNYHSAKVLRNTENTGYAQAVNKGITSMNGDFFIVGNSDVIFNHNTIYQMVEYLMNHSDVGVVGVQQIFPDGKWQRSYGDVPGIIDSIKNLVGITTLHNWLRRLVWPWRIDKYPKKVGYVDGAAMAIRKEAYKSVGGFDENFFFYCEEADFCLRLKKSGWKVVFLPTASIIHTRGGSSTNVDMVRKKYYQLYVNSKLLFFRKHYPHWQLPLYIWLERIHMQKLAFIYRLIGYFSPKSKRGYIYNRSREYVLLAKTWRRASEVLLYKNSEGSKKL